MAKVSELTNAPLWLTAAKVANEDVTIDSLGYVVWHRGEWLSGSFLGGYFLGGSFEGGSFEGGSFLGGSFEGGSFEGGYFLGGYFGGGYFGGGYFLGGYFGGGYFLGGSFLGGSFEGGSFLGGYFLGGSFEGGSFLGGYFEGGRIGKTKPAWILTVIPQVEGYTKTLAAVDGVAWVLAGCRWFTLAEARLHWANRPDRAATYALLEVVAALAKARGLRESNG